MGNREKDEKFDEEVKFKVDVTAAITKACENMIFENFSDDFDRIHILLGLVAGLHGLLLLKIDVSDVDRIHNEVIKELNEIRGKVHMFNTIERLKVSNN